MPVSFSRGSVCVVVHVLLYLSVCWYYCRFQVYYQVLVSVTMGVSTIGGLISVCW